MEKKSFLKNSNLKQLILLALDEDLRDGDITTQNTIRRNTPVVAHLIAKHPCVIAGLVIVPRIIELAREKHYIEHGMNILPLAQEGTVVKQDAVIAHLRGSVHDILKLERTILNFVSRISGVATYTYYFTQMLGKSRAKIFDTRKTIPGWRLLDKYAVACGGGVNHRAYLGEHVLIKDNHWEHDKQGVLAFLRRGKHTTRVEVEIDSLAMLRLPELWNADIIMLDNLSVNDMKKAITRIRAKEKQRGRKIEIEISGGVDAARMKQLAALDVDRISIGKITHSAPSMDISLEINKPTAYLHSK